MKKVEMFILADCPHCRRCREIMDELFAAHPAYAAVPITVIDEAKSPDLAAQRDYYYVPTFYVDGQKRMEGVPSKEAVAAVFAEACQP